MAFVVAAAVVARHRHPHTFRAAFRESCRVGIDAVEAATS